MLIAGGAGATQVAVRAVLQVLVLGVGVHRRHQAALDAERCRCSTLASGARQFVVHEALEMIVLAAGS